MGTVRTTFAILLALLTLSGCAEPIESGLAERAQTEMIGMTKSTLLKCAGVPSKSAVDGDRQYLNYSSVSMSTVEGSGSLRTCEATFILLDNRVESISYRPAGRAMTKDALDKLFGAGGRFHECWPIVQNCVKN